MIYCYEHRIPMEKSGHYHRKCPQCKNEVYEVSEW